jgi:hypothetical protein
VVRKDGADESEALVSEGVIAGLILSSLL